MTIAAKVVKLARLARSPRFAATLVRHRVAASVEQLEAIGFCVPATLVDIGANKGQFSTAVRALCPEAAIHGFEPLAQAANIFQSVFRRDERVHLHRCAIGSDTGKATFYVTDREDSSSLLKPGSRQKAAYGVRLARKTTVPVKKLEEVIDLSTLAHPILLKIDVQGTELEVLKGIKALDVIDFIYVELSFVELYEGQPLFEDVRAYLAKRGFGLRGIYNQSSTPAFGPTQADCLFVRLGKKTA